MRSTIARGPLTRLSRRLLLAALTLPASGLLSVALALPAWGLLSVALALPARAELEGFVYVDTNGNGARDAGEPGLAGVGVSNGRSVARSGEDGRYSLRERAGFVSLSRPAGFRAPHWYARGTTDFGLQPAPDPDAFFFIQVSDSHVYDRIADFEKFSMPRLPGWLPRYAVDWLTLWMLDRVYGSTHADGAAASMRRVLIERAATQQAGALLEARTREIEDMSDVQTLRAYNAELRSPASPLADVAGLARDAFDEVAALEPEFIVNTGDLILEGNAGSNTAIARWLRFYQSITDRLPMTVYDTIGNNEIAGNQNPHFKPDDPGYGKQSFEAAFGPTHYSFTRGHFHFIALDTHRPDPQDDYPEWWSFQKMDADVRHWFEEELEASGDRVVVVLNHEPFRIAPEWPLDDLEPADDEGLLERFAVPYTLTGHVHWNGLQHEGVTTHITTGALSGMRWILPPELHARGYRLVWAGDGQLHSAWKQLGEPVIALAEGGRDASRVVVVAADARGPFASVEIERAGERVTAERWGDYFFALKGSSGEQLEVEAARATGEVVRTPLSVP